VYNHHLLSLLLLTKNKKKEVALKYPDEFQRESFPAFRKEAAEESNFIRSFLFPDSSFGVRSLFTCKSKT